MSTGEAAAPDLDALLSFWQPLVRLADWVITARYVRHLDRAGYCEAQAPYKRADITMMHPIDWPDSRRPYDVEYHFVHELCHAHFAAFEIAVGSPLHLHEEQAVSSFARALIDLRRRTP